MGKTAAIKIERMVKGDVGQVLAIEQASFSMPWSRNLFLSEFRNSPISLMLVALAEAEKREVLGYIVCWAFVDELHILDLATSAAVRRQGVASRLVEAALRTAYAAGARRVFLEVRGSNDAALALYEGFGFTRTQVRPDYYDNPVEHAVVMELDVNGLRKAIGESTFS